MKITDASHLDHGLSPEHIAFIVERFGDRDGFFMETVELPVHLASLPCELWGPAMGDPPVLDTEVTLRPRGNRAGPSRLVARPARPVRLLTVIGGPSKDEPCVLYTAFGGPGAPREPWDPGLTTPAQLVHSRAFWAVHALSDTIG